ncbi:MAG: septum formation protein Maf [Saprospiraceae bacterium]|nr:septum formation protein Maf [Saprospiraceae bacterium]
MSKRNHLSKSILLASNSPRRLALLNEMGLAVRVQKVEVPEDFPPAMPLRQVAKYLAERKAMAARSLKLHGEIILGSDTIVMVDGRILEKPQDRDDAQNMLLQLSDRKHEVITGVCLISDHHKSIFHDVTEVRFVPIDLDEIDYYIDHYRPYDKAGSYGIQEWIGHCKISQILGSYTNVMGLPTAMIYNKLKTEF